ncbi:hypothetical protein L1887_48047 [Cichorium endivia]|nr:hypothetical protein L1887_48047 [Cichorium endivia]
MQGCSQHVDLGSTAQRGTSWRTVPPRTDPGCRTFGRGVHKTRASLHSHFSEPFQPQPSRRNSSWRLGKLQSPRFLHPSHASVEAGGKEGVFNVTALLGLGAQRKFAREITEQKLMPKRHRVRPVFERGADEEATVSANSAQSPNTLRWEGSPPKPQYETHLVASENPILVWDASVRLVRHGWPKTGECACRSRDGVKKRSRDRSTASHEISPAHQAVPCAARCYVDGPPAAFMFREAAPVAEPSRASQSPALPTWQLQAGAKSDTAGPNQQKQQRVWEQRPSRVEAKAGLLRLDPQIESPRSNSQLRKFFCTPALSRIPSSLEEVEAVVGFQSQHIGPRSGCNVPFYHHPPSQLHSLGRA